MTLIEMSHGLEGHARKLHFEPEPPYYIVGDFSVTDAEGKTLYSDEGRLWCKRHAEELVAAALPLLPAAERKGRSVCRAEVDEQDAPSRCFACCAPLDYYPTVDCIGEELKRYRAHPINPESLPPAEIWNISRLLGMAAGTEYEAEALALGRRAMELIS